MAKGHRFELVMGWVAILLVVALFVCPIVAVFVGPASNFYAVGSLHSLSSEHHGGRVFVRNPELAEELKILRASGVFKIVSADQADTRMWCTRCCAGHMVLPWPSHTSRTWGSGVFVWSATNWAMWMSQR